MEFFKKLNVISGFYGFLFSIVTTILLNPYRIQVFTGFTLKQVEILFFVLFFIGFISCGFLITFITKTWMNRRIASFWSAILWFPYWLIFALSFSYLFPNHYPEDDDNYGAAFAIFGLIIAYPFYLAITTFLGIRAKKQY